MLLIHNSYTLTKIKTIVTLMYVSLLEVGSFGSVLKYRLERKKNFFSKNWVPVFTIPTTDTDKEKFFAKMTNQTFKYKTKEYPQFITLKIVLDPKKLEIQKGCKETSEFTDCDNVLKQRCINMIPTEKNIASFTTKHAKNVAIKCMLQEKPMPIILKNAYYWLLVMEKMDFNILDLYQNLKFFDLLNINLKDLQQNIIQTVWDTFKCLHEQNKTYVDLKLQNVMVNIESDEKSYQINTIKLIDLDGICTLNNDERIQGTTFFPPSVLPWLRGTWKKVSRLEGYSFMDQKTVVYPDFLPSCNEATAIWNLVIFMLQIYSFRESPLRKSNYDALQNELVKAYSTPPDKRIKVPGFDVPVGIPKPINITKVLTALKHALPRTEQHQPIFPNVDTYFDYLINLSTLPLNDRKNYFENNDELFNANHPELKTLFNEVVLE